MIHRIAAHRQENRRQPAQQKCPALHRTPLQPRQGDQDQQKRPLAGSHVQSLIRHPEDSALVLDTTRGLVVITGCGHAGVINTLNAARGSVRSAPIHALVGGLHLLRYDEEKLKWTADKFREFGVAHLLAAHCTGLEATYRLRALAGLARETAVVAAVGATVDLQRGIDPLMLAK